MTGVFQGLAADDGKIPAVVVTSLPPDAVSRNGILVSPAGELYIVNDVSQPRVFKYGMAFEASTGLLILGNTANVPYSLPMGGMLVDVKGAFLGTEDAPDVIHQAIGLKITQNAGIVTGTGLTPPLQVQIDASQDQVNKTGDVVSSIVAVDGNQYTVNGGSGVTHGTVKSPTNLDTYTFDGSLNSFMKRDVGVNVPQPFTIFVALKKNATGALTVFDNL